MAVPADLKNSFLEIDKALASHYDACGRNDYYNNSFNRKGKFMEYIIEQELMDDGLPITDELGPDCDPHDCSYTDFDPNFPLPNEITNEYEKEAYIFWVIQYCFQSGMFVISISSHPQSVQILACV